MVPAGSVFVSAEVTTLEWRPNSAPTCGGVCASVPETEIAGRIFLRSQPLWRLSIISKN